MLDIHKYIYLIHSISNGLIRDIRAYQKIFPVLNPKYVKTKWRYDPEFLHMVRHLQKQQINPIILSCLLVWFLRFDLKSFWANQIAELLT